MDFEQQFVVPTPPGIMPGWLDISGPWVVYEGGDPTMFPVPDPEAMIGGSGLILPEWPVEVYAYNRNTTLTTPVTTAPRYQGTPAVHNGYVVWVDARVENQVNIWGRDLAGGPETPISTYPTGQFQPDVSDRYVVWADSRRGATYIQDIWGYDRQTGEEFQVARAPEGLGFNLPRVSGSTAAMPLGTPPGIEPRRV